MGKVGNENRQGQNLILKNEKWEKKKAKARTVNDENDRH